MSILPIRLGEAPHVPFTPPRPKTLSAETIEKIQYGNGDVISLIDVPHGN
jgi:hypothetical protein